MASAPRGRGRLSLCLISRSGRGSCRRKLAIFRPAAKVGNITTNGPLPWKKSFRQQTPTAGSPSFCAGFGKGVAMLLPVMGNPSRGSSPPAESRGRGQRALNASVPP